MSDRRHTVVQKDIRFLSERHLQQTVSKVKRENNNHTNKKAKPACRFTSIIGPCAGRNCAKNRIRNRRSGAPGVRVHRWGGKHERVNNYYGEMTAAENRLPTRLSTPRSAVDILATGDKLHNRTLLFCENLLRVTGVG